MAAPSLHALCKSVRQKGEEKRRGRRRGKQREGMVGERSRRKRRERGEEDSNEDEVGKGRCECASMY